MGSRDTSEDHTCQGLSPFFPLSPLTTHGIRPLWLLAMCTRPHANLAAEMGETCRLKRRRRCRACALCQGRAPGWPTGGDAAPGVEVETVGADTAARADGAIGTLSAHLLAVSVVFLAVCSCDI